MSADLQKLSAAATPGPWFAAVGGGPKRRKQTYAVVGVASMRGQGEAGALAVFSGVNSTSRGDDAEFVVELVNAFREGRLSPVGSVPETEQPE